MNVNNLMAELERKHPGENEYLQAIAKYSSPSRKFTTNILSSRKPRSLSAS